MEDPPRGRSASGDESPRPARPGVITYVPTGLLLASFAGNAYAFATVTSATALAAVAVGQALALGLYAGTAVLAAAGFAFGTHANLNPPDAGHLVIVGRYIGSLFERRARSDTSA